MLTQNTRYCSEASKTKLEAVDLRADNRWAVRPIGQLGTCGWVCGFHWNVVYVTASSAEVAVSKAFDDVWRSSC
jgi:hypothetical protein